MYGQYHYRKQDNTPLWAIFWAIVFFGLVFLVALKYEYVYDWYRLSCIQSQLSKEDPSIMSDVRFCIFHPSAAGGEIMEKRPIVKKKIYQYWDLLHEEERIYKRHPDWRN